VKPDLGSYDVVFLYGGNSIATLLMDRVFIDRLHGGQHVVTPNRPPSHGIEARYRIVNAREIQSVSLWYVAKANLNAISSLCK
jgi:hypothetical protein